MGIFKCHWERTLSHEVKKPMPTTADLCHARKRKNDQTATSVASRRTTRNFKTNKWRGAKPAEAIIYPPHAILRKGRGHFLRWRYFLYKWRRVNFAQKQRIFIWVFSPLQNWFPLWKQTRRSDLKGRRCKFYAEPNFIHVTFNQQQTKKAMKNASLIGNRCLLFLFGFQTISLLNFLFLQFLSL